MPIDADLLKLDPHTLEDLEIFVSAPAQESLFEFCNSTRTQGGEKVLKRRMGHPWSKVDRIVATQKSLSFILKHRHVFSLLPTAYATGRASDYASEILPVISDGNIVEFSFSVMSMWSTNDPHYASILRGVHVSYGLINTLRNFIHSLSFTGLEGELSPLLEEMQLLLSRPKLSLVSNKKPSSKPWKVLRLDQLFRVHEKTTVARLLEIVFEIDALIALADTTDKHGFILPHVGEGSLQFKAEGLIHPFVVNAVANRVEMNQQQRVLFLTGPNMAGKTTYLRACATALYFAHLGMGVSASSFHFTPTQRLFSSISLSDDLHGGVSYFRAEALRVKAVAKAIADGCRVIAVMDEPFKGTNVKDAVDASLAILQRFSKKNDCLFMFSSHLIELSEQLQTGTAIDCRYFEAKENGERLSFDYLLRSGVSKQRLGMRVLQEKVCLICSIASCRYEMSYYELGKDDKEKQRA